MATQTHHIAVAAGGTGGHLFPALAVIEELQQQKEISPVFFGTAHRIESKVIPQLQFPFFALPISSTSTLLSLQTLRLPWRLFRSLLRSIELLKAMQPAVVLCTGAYISLPVGLAASALSIPLVLMEANSIPGRTIRWLAPMADRIFLSFEETLHWLPKRVHQRCTVSGNPIRPSLLIDIPTPEQAKRSFGFQPESPVVLVLGGSLGAQSLNRAIAQLLPQFIQSGIQLLWQTGQHSVSPPPASAAAIQQTSFIEDMKTAYAAADLVISRAGASAIAEIAAFGKAAIFVPYPYAVHHHQHHNVRALLRHQAALFVEDHQLSTSLWELIQQVLCNPKLKQTLETNIRRFARPQAARTIATQLSSYF